MISTNLVTTLRLSLSFPFVETKSLEAKRFLFFVYGKPRFTSKACRIQETFIKGIFLHLIPACFIVLHFQ